MLLQEEGASETIDPEALLARSDHYARREGATAETLGEQGILRVHTRRTQRLRHAGLPIHLSWVQPT